MVTDQQQLFQTLAQAIRGRIEHGFIYDRNNCMLNVTTAHLFRIPTIFEHVICFPHDWPRVYANLNSFRKMIIICIFTHSIFMWTSQWQEIEATTCLKKSLPRFINSIQLSFTQKAPYGLFRVIWILCNIQAKLLSSLFKSTIKFVNKKLRWFFPKVS